MTAGRGDQPRYRLIGVRPSTAAGVKSSGGSAISSTHASQTAPSPRRAARCETTRVQRLALRRELAVVRPLRQICCFNGFDKGSFEMRNINLDQLRALIEVVQCRSFSAAARSLNLSQPAVSLQIRELERRFGVPLIERFGKQAHATAPGRELIKAAQHIFDACTSAEEAMRRFRENWIGRVHLNTTLTAMIYRLPPLLRKLRSDHPGVDLVVTNMPTPLSIAKILSNEADLALVTLPVENSELRVQPLCQEAMLAALPAGEKDVPEEITPEYIM